MQILTTNELKKKLAHGVLLIDVREPAEYKSGYIEGAYLIPLAEISHEKLPQKSSPIVIYCHFGRRSEEACKKLLAQDPTLNVYSLEGGIAAWQASGYAVKI